MSAVVHPTAGTSAASTRTLWRPDRSAPPPGGVKDEDAPRTKVQQAQQAGLQAQRRHVRVTERTTCAICLKRLGNAVFVLQPDDDLAHFVCYRASKRR